MDPKSSFSRLLAREDRVLQMCTAGEPGEHNCLWGCGAGGREVGEQDGGRGGRCSEATAVAMLGGGGAVEGALSLILALVMSFSSQLGEVDEVGKHTCPLGGGR
jgi:hypothetical protein